MAYFDDPFGGFDDDPFGDPFGSFGRKRREPKYPPMSDATFNTALAELASAPLSALGWIGQTFAKPARALWSTVEGLKSGDWSGGGPLNMIPFSDTLNITDPQKAVGLSDVVMGKRAADAPFEWGDFGKRLGLDIVGDPLTYLTSPLTKAGVAAEKLSLVPKGAKALGKYVGPREAGMTNTFDDVLSRATRDISMGAADDAARAAGYADDFPKLLGGQPTLPFAAAEAIADPQPLRSLAAFGLPFGIGPKLHVGTGKTALGVAKKFDVLGKGIRESAPVSAAAALFDRSAGDKWTKEGQELARISHRIGEEAAPAEQAILLETQAARKTLENAWQESYGEKLAPKATGASAFPYDVNDVVKASDRDNYGWVTEVGPKGARVFFESPEGYAAEKFLEHNILTLAHKKGTAEAEKMASAYTGNILDRIMQLTREKDLPTAIGEITDLGAFGPPRILGGQDSVGKQIEALAGKLGAVNKTRGELIIAKGGLLSMLDSEEGLGYAARYGHPKEMKRQLPEMPRTAGSMMARSEELRFLPKEIGNKLATDPMVRGNLSSADNILKNYGDYLGGGYDGDKAAHAQALAARFAEAPERAIYPYTGWRDQVKHSESMDRVSRNIDAAHELFYANMSTTKGDGMISIREAFNRSGLDADAASKHFADKYKLPANGFVPESYADAVRATFEIPKSKEWMDRIAKVIDPLTQAFKRGVYLPFPATWTRNSMTGQLVNLTTGEVKMTEIPKYVGKFSEAAEILKAPEKHVELIREIMSHGFLGKHSQDVAINASDSGLPENALKIIQLFKDEMAKAAQPSTLPLGVGGTMNLAQKIPGVGKGVQLGRAVAETAMETGAKVNQYGEWFNRVPLYLFLKDKGNDAFTAAKKVTDRHFLYDPQNYTAFENDVMSRAVPFFKFQKNVMQMVFKNLYDRPGGLMAQSIKGATELREQQPGGFVPSWIGQGLAVPIGAEKEGTQRFLGTLDTPQEAAAQLFRPGRTLTDTVSGTMASMGAQLNPLIKAPIELATNRSLFSGRDLSELDSRLGRIAQRATGAEQPPEVPNLVDWAFMNSPWSRGATAVGTVLDKRPHQTTTDWAVKAGLNLFTGARLTDANVDKARNQAALDAIREDLNRSGSPTLEYSKPYLPKGQTASPEDMQRLALFQATMDRLREDSLERKAKAGDMEAVKDLLKMRQKREMAR